MRKERAWLTRSKDNKQQKQQPKGFSVHVFLSFGLALSSLLKVETSYKPKLGFLPQYIEKDKYGGH
jgi:hypothetical protein